MSAWPNLSQRCHELELMDRADSRKDRLWRTLRHFRDINRFLTPSRRLLRRFVIQVMKSDRHRRWSMLDVGAGGGDLAIWFVRQCSNEGLEVDVTCMDHDERVVEFASGQCRGIDSISVVRQDALALAQSPLQWDFVFANHFLHHLSDEQVVATLSAIQSVCRVRFILSDIRRSMANYLFFTAAASVFFRNSLTYDDGRLSIRKGFTIPECVTLVRTANLPKAVRVSRFYPGHLAIIGGPGGMA